MGKKTKTRSPSSGVFEKVGISVKKIRRITQQVPEIVVILGTGLGSLGQRIRLDARIPYADIPHFPVSTVESHAGTLAFGRMGEKNVAVMEGRFHLYEGYSPGEIIYPLRVLQALGMKILVVTNVSGALNLSYRKGDVVLITDHINFMGVNPLTGPHEDRFGPRFPDMSAPYSARLLSLAESAARKVKIPVQKGIYIGVLGPNLETRAEYRMMRAFGADLVGMSTLPEVIAGVQMGTEILGVSIVTDVCDPDHLEAVDIQEVIRVAREAAPRLDRLVETAIKDF